MVFVGDLDPSHSRFSGGDDLSQEHVARLVAFGMMPHFSTVDRGRSVLVYIPPFGANGAEVVADDQGCLLYQIGDRLALGQSFTLSPQEAEQLMVWVLQAQAGGTGR